MNKRQRKKIFHKHGAWLPLPGMKVDGIYDAKVSFFSLGAYSNCKCSRKIIKENLNIDPNPYIYRIVYQETRI